MFFIWRSQYNIAGEGLGSLKSSCSGVITTILSWCRLLYLVGLPHVRGRESVFLPNHICHQVVLVMIVSSIVIVQPCYRLQKSNLSWLGISCWVFPSPLQLPFARLCLVRICGGYFETILTCPPLRYRFSLLRCVLCGYGGVCRTTGCPGLIWGEHWAIRGLCNNFLSHVLSPECFKCRYPS